LGDRTTDVHEAEKQEIEKNFLPRRHPVACVVPFGDGSFVRSSPL
jgi:hypothetical protein